MLKAGFRLIAFITRSHTPIPKNTENFLAHVSDTRHGHAEKYYYLTLIALATTAMDAGRLVLQEKYTGLFN